jgi:hypothetical protein
LKVGNLVVRLHVPFIDRPERPPPAERPWSARAPAPTTAEALVGASLDQPQLVLIPSDPTGGRPPVHERGRE